MAAATESCLPLCDATQTTGEEILKKCLKDLGLEVDEKDLEYIAWLCQGFEGIDLRLLCVEAGSRALVLRRRRISTTSGSSKYVIKVNREDFIESKKIALARMTSSLDMLPTDVTWDDIGGLQSVKGSLKKYVLEATKLGGSCSTRGVLLYGPKGCGKTSLVMAAAGAAQASLFCLLFGSILFDSDLEGAEEMIRRTFRVARLFPPSIIFLHDMHCFFIKRGEREYDGGRVYTAKDESHAQQVFNVFLEEMKGLHDAQGVVVVSIIVDAYHEVVMKQAGAAFDMALSVPLPNLQERMEILNIKTKPFKLAADVNLEYVAQKTENYNGAMLQSLIRNAKSFVDPDKASCISMHDFQCALDNAARVFDGHWLRKMR